MKNQTRRGLAPVQAQKAIVKVKLSPETKNEPTHTKTLQRDYVRALVRLFRRFEEQAIEALQHARLSQVSDKNSIDLAWFDSRIRDIALSTIIVPGKHITAERTVMNYRAGLKFADLALKRAGLITASDYTPDSVILKNDRQVIDNLIVSNLSDLRGISDETIKQIIQGLTAILKRHNSETGFHTNIRHLQDINETGFVGVISDTVESVGITRADALGSTGTITAFSTAEEREYARNGVDQVVWITAGDDSACDICVPLDGQVLEMDDSFDPPPLHIHCRCTFIPAEGYITPEPEVIVAPEVPEIQELLKREIPVLKSSDISKEDMDRYRNKYHVEKEVFSPIPDKEMTELVSEIANRPEMVKQLGDVKIVLIPWGEDCRAWTDPIESNTIFIPQYDVRDYDIEKEYGLIKFANGMEQLMPELKDNEYFQNWKSTLPEATLEDAIEKTLLHEKGHLEMMDALERMAGDKKYREYFYSTEGVTNFLKQAREYTDVPEVAIAIAEITEQSPKAVPYKVGEMIAEDYRIMKAPGDSKYIFPHTSFTQTDLVHPDRMKARQAILQKIFKW